MRVIEAVQWTGENLAEVLQFAGHNNSSINSFGNPCVKVGDELEAVEIGRWVFGDSDGGLHICSGPVLDLLEVLVRIAAEAETKAEVLEQRVARVRQMCELMVREKDAREILAVLDGELASRERSDGG